MSLLGVIASRHRGVFVSLWETTILNEPIQLPVSNLYPVDWGDGTFTTTETSHVFIDIGIYEVKMYGEITDFAFDNTGDKNKLNEITNIGGLHMIQGGFYGCLNLILTETGNPLFIDADISNLFRNCDSLLSVPSINEWDLSTVTTLDSFLRGNNNYDQPLTLDIPLVVNANNMLSGCESMNSSITLTNTNSLTNTEALLSGCTLFNQTLSIDDTSNITTMKSMFSGCIVFNKDIDFDTSSVEDFEFFLIGATSFNGLVSLNTSSAIIMRSMFNGCESFNQPVSFDTSSVTDMSGMFIDCSIFNQPVSFDTSSVADMSGMFANCFVFDQPVLFNTSSVTDMNGMFFACNNFNQTITFDTALVNDMSFMFESCTSLNSVITFTDTSLVTTMFHMFLNCSIFNQPVSFDTSSVANMSLMFLNCSVFNQPIAFNTSSVADMSGMFANCFVFDQDISGLDYSSVTNINNFMFGKSNINYTASYYDNLLIKWDNAIGGLIFANMVDVNIGMGTIKYTMAGATARASLISKGFIITDGGLV
jgi:surface protein